MNFVAHDSIKATLCTSNAGGKERKERKKEARACARKAKHQQQQEREGTRGFILRKLRSQVGCGSQKKSKTYRAEKNTLNVNMNKCISIFFFFFFLANR